MTDRPGRRAWRSRPGASVVPTAATSSSPSPTSQDEVDVMETRPFLNNAAASSSAAAAKSSSTFGSTVPGRIVSKTTLGRLYQGVMSQTLGSSSSSTATKKKRDSSHLLHHHHHHHKNNIDAIHVQVPKRLMYYTAAVFLVLPLTIFIWKEFHLHPPPPHEALTDKQQQQQQHHHQHMHDQFPTWMDQDENNGMPPPQTKGNLKGSAAAAKAKASRQSKSSSSRSSDKVTSLEGKEKEEKTIVGAASNVDDLMVQKDPLVSEEEGGSQGKSGHTQSNESNDTINNESMVATSTTTTTTTQSVALPIRDVLGDVRDGNVKLKSEIEITEEEEKEVKISTKSSDPNDQREAPAEEETVLDDSGSDEDGSLNDLNRRL